MWERVSSAGFEGGGHVAKTESSLEGWEQPPTTARKEPGTSALQSQLTRSANNHVSLDGDSEFEGEI